MRVHASLQLNSWLMQIGLATIGQNGDMGANLSTARDFLELHERLSEDMKVICHSLQLYITTNKQTNRSRLSAETRRSSCYDACACQ